MRRWVLAAAFATVALSGCGPDWVMITEVTASGPEADVVMILLDICHPNPDAVPASAVTETENEVRIRLQMKHVSKDEDACLGGVPVQLAAPIGDRLVVDTRAGSRFKVTFED